MSVPHVLLWLADLGGGGAQRTMLNLAPALGAHNLEVELVIGQSDGPAREWLDPRLPHRALGARSLTRSLPALVRTVRALKPQAILSTMLDANVAAYLAGRCAAPGAAILLRETNSLRARADIGPLRRRLACFAYRRADRVIALSEGVRRELIADMNLAPAQVVTIPNPVRRDEIAAAVAAARGHSRPAGLRADLRYVLAIGRLHPQKGYDILIDAMAAQDEDIGLVILGEGPDRPALEHRARQSGLADRIHMPGFLCDTAPYLAHASLFALSSRWEGFGHVIVEAMAAELPVVATDCPYGPADIIRAGETGLLVRPEDPEALGLAIRRLLSDPAAARKLAVAGAAAAQRYDTDRIAGEYAAVIAGAIRNRSIR